MIFPPLLGTMISFKDGRTFLPGGPAEGIPYPIWYMKKPPSGMPYKIGEGMTPQYIEAILLFSSFRIISTEGLSLSPYWGREGRRLYYRRGWIDHSRESERYKKEIARIYPENREILEGIGPSPRDYSMLRGLNLHLDSLRFLIDDGVYDGMVLDSWVHTRDSILWNLTRKIYPLAARAFWKVDLYSNTPLQVEDAEQQGVDVLLHPPPPPEEEYDIFITRDWKEWWKKNARVTCILGALPKYSSEPQGRPLLIFFERKNKTTLKIRVDRTHLTLRRLLNYLHDPFWRLILSFELIEKQMSPDGDEWIDIGMDTLITEDYVRLRFGGQRAWIPSQTVYPTVTRKGKFEYIFHHGGIFTSSDFFTMVFRPGAPP